MQIIVRQLSGLGNQLFQYAAGLYYATKYSAALRLVTDPAGDRPSGGFPRPFQLPEFRIPAAMRRATLIEEFLCSRNARVEKLAAAARGLLNVRLYLEPAPHRFYPDLPYDQLPRTVYLRSYWQAAGYAEAVREQLRGDLQLKHEARGKDAEALAAIRASRCAVSVHMRRGDYVMAKQRLVLPLSYYRRAWTTMLASFADAEFFVFSDDIEYARENLPREGARRFVDHNDALTAYEDLRLMSACSHHVIANSSFSWWGAWMNPHPAKIVIAPKYWRNTEDSYYPDLFPAGWRLVENLVEE